MNEINYGPLKALIGTWKGDKGTDIAPEPNGEENNPYFETITYEAIGDVSNAEMQTLVVLHYKQIVQRADLILDRQHQRCLVFPCPLRRFLRQHQKSGHIVQVIFNARLDDFQPVQLARQLRGNRSRRRLINAEFGRPRRAGHFHCRDKSDNRRGPGCNRQRSHEGLKVFAGKRHVSS